MSEQLPKCKRAVIYCRVSTDKQEQDGASLEYQEAKCRQYAELHNIEVVIALREAKSGFIHYSHREQLTLARQFIRDHMADMIIVFDLRRFSRNFVHSAMIFEEIESNHGEIVSVSENIDNSLTGKLIRSILAWSAESEREKILEYANRHWQVRLEQNLPVATGRAPYGWNWADEEKTFYVINQEEATVRFSIFQMFVELNISIRGIAHKLTEDGMLPPAKSRGANVRSMAWQPSTVHMILTDEINIGVLRILRSKKIITPRGTEGRAPNEHMKKNIDGIPAIIPVELYELAQLKLETNKVNLSHLHRNPEDYLLKSHIFCKVCGYRMVGRYRFSKKTHCYAYYCCVNHKNKYDCCPDPQLVRTDKIDKLAWEDCCRAFESLDLIQETLNHNIEQSLQLMLEDTKGKQLIEELSAEIVHAKQERDKHPEESYTYRVIAQDIRVKEERLRKCEEQYEKSSDVLKISDIYQKSIMGFLDLLNTMKGRYHEASFKEKRNALTVLGVKVYISPDSYEPPAPIVIESDQEWFSIGEAVQVTGISEGTLAYHSRAGRLSIQRRPAQRKVIHRDELAKYLLTKRRNQTHEINLDDYEDEWFTVNKLVVNKIATWHTLHRAVGRGEVHLHTVDELHPFIHRDELNRFLRENPIRPRSERENVTPRVEITYTPIFTGVQQTLDRSKESPFFREGLPGVPDHFSQRRHYPRQAG